MKLHRFITNIPIVLGTASITDATYIKQITHVLRLKKGDQIILSDGNLNEGLATITDICNDSVQVEIASVSENTAEPTNHTVLYCAILKRENFEWVVQKATELGIKEIVPVTSKRTVKLNIRQDRLEKIIKEAAEQSGRGVMPVLRKAISFETALEDAKNNSQNIFFDEDGASLPADNLSEKTVKKIGLFVGPEGGWDSTEGAAATTANIQVISLGPLTLRAETAAVVACYIGTHLL